MAKTTKTASKTTAKKTTTKTTAKKYVEKKVGTGKKSALVNKLENGTFQVTLPGRTPRTFKEEDAALKYAGRRVKTL